MSNLNKIPSISASDADKLGRAHIYTAEQLLNRCSDRHGRQTVASVTGINEEQLLTYANKADLHRVKGVGASYDNLFEAAGVNSINDLSKSNAHELYQEMRRVNDKQHLVKQAPSESQIKQIVTEARKTNSKISP